MSNFKWHGGIGIRADANGDWFISEQLNVPMYEGFDELMNFLTNFRETHENPTYDVGAESDYYGGSFATFTVRGTRKAVTPEDMETVNRVLESLREDAERRARYQREQYERLRTQFEGEGS